jgi:magnesium chelatase family protein
MLARRVASILPPLSLEEAIEASTVWSVAGLLAPSQGLLSARPFRSPHHTASEAELIGGGGVPHPGEISLAHHGILFLDELPEFSMRVLEALCRPLEDARVVVSRSAGTVVFPARFQLSPRPIPAAAAAPRWPTCVCAPPERARYLGRLSRPLLDRIDLHLEIPALERSRHQRPPAEAAPSVDPRNVT